MKHFPDRRHAFTSKLTGNFLHGVSLSICVLMILAQFTQASAAELPTNIPYIVIDRANGEVAIHNKANQPWHPASLTKLMTTFVTLNEMRTERVSAGSPVRISNRANKMPPSRMGYKTGTLLRVDTALKIITVKSANDVSVALAEAVSGSVEQFVATMNTTAVHLGMKNTHFTNPNGLHNAKQVTSAADMALLARALWQEYPDAAKMYSLAAIKTTAKTHFSYNLLLERYPGADGMKTGFVCASGYNMVASANKGGRHLIAVILGSKSQTERAVLAARALNIGFQKPTNSETLDSLIAMSTSTPPNMRAKLCSQEARKKRYEPGAGQAKIKAPELHARIRSNRIALITTGNITNPPSDAFLSRKFANIKRVPVPQKRPNFKPPEPIDGMSRISDAFRGTIPLPMERPVN